MTLVDAEGNPVGPVAYRIKPRVPMAPVPGFPAEVGTDGLLRWTRDIHSGEEFWLTPAELAQLRALAGRDNDGRSD